MKRKLMTLVAAFIMVCTVAAVGTTMPVQAVTSDTITWKCGHTEAIRANTVGKDANATCETGTLYSAFCDTCMDFVEGEVNDAPGHDFTRERREKQYEVSPATCKDPAVYVFSCQNCKAAGTKTFVGEKLVGDRVHDYKQIACDARQCTVCKKIENVYITSHNWKAATCTTPKTCTKCGKTEGTVAHKWKDATCATPKTCELCGVTEPGLKSHSYYEATCTAPKTCRDCGATEGEPIPHKWSKQTCVTSKVCGVCGEIGAPPLPHNEVVEPRVEPTCNTFGWTEGKRCADCKTLTVKPELLVTVDHVEAYVSIIPATYSMDGKLTSICKNCHQPYNVVKIPKASDITVKEKVVYTGKAKKPTVTVKDSTGKKLKQGTDYTLKYGDNKAIGTAYVDIIFQGNYYGKIAKKFDITPQIPTIKKPVVAKKALTAKWIKGKKAQVNGYEVMCSVNKDFIGMKRTVTVKGFKKTSVKIKKLQSKKIYYVKVRAYKTVKVVGRPVNIYSDWSKVMKVKVK